MKTNTLINIIIFLFFIIFVFLWQHKSTIKNYFFSTTKQHSLNQQHKEATPLSKAQDSLKTYILTTIHTRNLPLTHEEKDKLINDALIAIQKDSFSINAHTNYSVPIKTLIHTKMEFKKAMQLQFPEHFQANMTSKGYFTRPLAKNRIKAEIMNLIKHKDQTEAKKIWGTIKKDVVNEQLNIRIFIDGQLPVIEEKDVNDIIDLAKRYLKEEVLTKKRP